MESLFDQIKVLWLNMKAIGLFPEITIAGMAIYFIVRFFLNKDKMISIYSILGINFLGQLYYAFPSSLRDFIGTLFFTLVQGALAIALYSFLEGAGAVAWLRGKLFKGEKDAPPSV